MTDKNRNSISKKRGNTSNVGASFISLLLLLVVGVVLSFVFWSIANEKVLAVNSLYSDPDDIKFADEDIIIDSKKVKLPVKGEQLGTIKIPSIDLESPLFVGDSDEELAKGCGMDLSMKYPGQNGNVVLSGHTNLVFKNLGGVKDGDEVILDTYYATFTYKANSHEIVSAKDTNVIVEKDKEFLTIYTCYPFNFLASTDKRYVLRCDFVQKEDKKELKTK